jgi:hypothetical protein
MRVDWEYRPLPEQRDAPRRRDGSGHSDGYEGARTPLEEKKLDGEEDGRDGRVEEKSIDDDAETDKQDEYARADEDNGAVVHDFQKLGRRGLNEARPS